MDRKNDMNLREAIPETPKMCREAVLQAVSTYQEERSMRKICSLTVIAAIIAVLLCGAAFAIVYHYSVRDYVADGKPSEAFDAAVVSLGRSVTTNGLTFTLGDAVFDGTDLAFTMNLASAEDAEPLYLCPTLTAVSDGQELAVMYQGFNMTYDTAFLMPAIDERYALPEQCGVDAYLADGDVPGDVTWRYTLEVYRPLAPLENARQFYSADESYKDWQRYLRDLHANGKIGVICGTSVCDYLNAVHPYGDEPVPYRQIVLDSGMFELADTVVFEFETPAPIKQQFDTGETFSFDGYTITVRSITESVRQVHYTLEARFDKPQPKEHEMELFYALTDQNGQPMEGSGGITLSKDHLSAILEGSAERISDEPLTAITFTQDYRLTMDQTDTAEDMPSFTVKLDQ